MMDKTDDLHSDVLRQEREVGQLEQELLKLPPEAQQEMAGYIAQARQSLKAGHPVPSVAMTQIHQALQNVEMRQMQQAVVGGTLAFAAFSGLTQDVTAPGAVLLANHLGRSEDGKTVPLASLGEAAFFTPAYNPGMQVAIMPAIDRGAGFALERKA